MPPEDGDGGGDEGGGEVDEVVAYPAAAFDGGSEETVEEEADGGGGEDDGAFVGKQVMQGAGCYDDGCCGDSGEGSGKADAAIGAGWDAAERRDEEGRAADGLADLGGDGVGGGFGECGDAGGVLADCGAQGGDAEVGDDLRGAAAVAWLGEAPFFFLGATVAGGEEGEEEERDQSGDGWPEDGMGRRGCREGRGLGEDHADEKAEEGGWGRCGAEEPDDGGECSAEQNRDQERTQREAGLYGLYGAKRRGEQKERRDGSEERVRLTAIASSGDWLAPDGGLHLVTYRRG